MNDTTKTIHFVSVRTVGLRAIIIDPKHIKPEKSVEFLPSGYWEAHSKLIMADGSIGITHHVPVPASFLRQLKTDPDSGQQVVFPSQ